MKVTVVVPDLQVPYHSKRSIKNLVEFIKYYEPDQVATAGDEMDMQTLSRWSKGTKMEYEGSIGKDRDETCRVLEELQVSHMIRSNHTDRLLNTIKTRVPGLDGLPELTMEGFFRMKDLGITYHADPYEIVPGWLLMHGDEGSQNSNAGMTARALAQRTGMSVVCGHTHRQGKVPFTLASGPTRVKTLYGVEAGNLMDYKHAKYIKGGMYNWQQGFVLLYEEGKNITPVEVPVQRDGSFIVEGFKWG